MKRGLRVQLKEKSAGPRCCSEQLWFLKIHHTFQAESEMSRVCSLHKFEFFMSCVVYWSGEDESFSSDWQQSRRLFSLACPAALYQSSCFSRSASSSLSRLRSEQSAISPCKAAELNRSEETKKKKRKKKKRTLFSSGTFFQLGIKAAVFVRMENTMMLQLDH